MIGRTHWLADTAELALEHGHEVTFLCTAKASAGARANETHLEELARRKGIPFYNDVGIVRRRDELTADVCLSVNWTTVLPQHFIDHFAYGILNAHAGDLPRYRGNATLNWAILNNETEACLTVHQMVEELDAGPIALKRYRPIGPETDMTELSAWLDTVIPESLVEVLDRIEDGTQVFTPQDPEVRPLRAYPRKPEDSRIDWKAPADEILRLIRASAPPFSGALTRMEDGREIVIFRAQEILPNHDVLAVPGQVCFAIGGNPVIATGTGLVELLLCSDDGATKSAILSSLRNRLR